MMSETLSEAVDDVLIKLATRQAARIEALEADVAQWVRQAEDNSGSWQRASLRIERLEAALRMIIMKGDERAEEIARAALEQDK